VGRDIGNGFPLKIPYFRGMNSKWIWIGLATVAAALIVWVFVRLLFGNISDHLYEGLHAEAQVQLNRICELQQQYHQKHQVYTQDLEAMGFYEDPEDGSKFVYEVGLADSSHFIARAFCKKDYDRDQNQLTWEVREDCKAKMVSED
jgi:hypothetical protein